ncbi:NYN domain-containing protein [Candidatus Saccharibacteria bacterium]|nr:NYN domain-containing protein [Candidatus Saccharibacteria bacterium]
MSLLEAKTYIYIDVSNIRHACLWSCGFNLNFIKLYSYLKEKYPNVQEVRYYEGVSSSDKKKLKHFRFLSEKIGYKICSLTRKGYVEPPRYETFECKNCKFPNKVKVLSESIKLKSNVDVYLTSDLLECAARAKEPINVVILSCDGDYAEAIKAALRLSPDSCVTVLATPMTETNNCLSVRLKHLSRELNRDNYKLSNINNIRDYVSQPPRERLED